VERAMAFRKAQDLMRLAEMAGSRYRGVCLNDVCDAFSVNQRTAQRMMHEFEEAFPAFLRSADRDRRRWWKLNDTALLRMQGVRDSELAALDMSIRRAQRDGAELDVKALVSLRDRLLAIMPSSHARRADADAAAMLEAQGYACRPGPRTKMILGTIAVGSFAINIGRGRVKVYINATSTVECGLNTGFVAQYGRMSPNAGSVTLRNQRLAG